MLFYVFKMAVAIASLRGFAVEEVLFFTQLSSHLMCKLFKKSMLSNRYVCIGVFAATFWLGFLQIKLSHMNSFFIYFS